MDKKLMLLMKYANHDGIAEAEGKYGEKKHHAEHEGAAVLDERTAREWVLKMSDPESTGKPGEHWTMAQTSQLVKQMRLPYDPVEFYAVMNMMYSDYYCVAKKYDQDRNADFFVELSKAWFDDKDVAAGNQKTSRYYREIVV